MSEHEIGAGVHHGVRERPRVASPLAEVELDSDRDAGRGVPLRRPRASSRRRGLRLRPPGSRSDRAPSRSRRSCAHGYSTKKPTIAIRAPPTSLIGDLARGGRCTGVWAASSAATVSA